MAKTTNILDLNNRLEKVEKENVTQNSYTSLKNKPKINNVTLTGNKSSSDLGLVTSSKAYSAVSLNPTYDADSEWNIVKQGNICVLIMRNLKDIPIGDTVIGTIPVGFRPEWSLFEYVYVGNKDAHVGFNFDGNGGITCLNHTGSILTDVIFVNRNVIYFTA